MTRIATVVGARPQFIKAAPVSKAIAAHGLQEYLIHTGQHYDYGMSQVFFDELDLREPDVNLGIGQGTHAQQTGRMLIAIEQVLLDQKPDWVLVYGDTNSTLAGGLAAVKLHIPLAHVEAGLRSFNRLMPEEHNRVLVDHCADLLFCPTQTAVKNLKNEGLSQGIHLVGDTMYDAVLQFSGLAQTKSSILTQLKLNPRSYSLATIHRAYNTDDPGALKALFDAFGKTGEKIILPIHPRTANSIKTNRIQVSENVTLIDPVSYLDMLMLEQQARLILTDSGGVQKEAYFFGVPCITLRPETEWIETRDSGWNQVVGNDLEKIMEAVNKKDWPREQPIGLFGDGHAAEKIAALLR